MTIPNENIQTQVIITANDAAVTDGNPLPSHDPDIGETDDAAVIDPTATATEIALLKGILTEIILSITNAGAKADAAVVNPASSASSIALLKGVLTEVLAVATATGAKADAAVVDPSTTTASQMALLKGLLTELVALNTNLTTLNTNIGAKADVAVTSLPADASVIAALKGVITNTTSA